jgi:hypothetical protein
MTDPCRKDEHTDLIRRLREDVPGLAEARARGWAAAATIESLERSLAEADEALIWATNQWVAGKDGADAHVLGRKILVPAYDAAKARQKARKAPHQQPLHQSRLPTDDLIEMSKKGHL